MPTWLQITLAVITSAIGVTYFFDKYFRTRKASERDEQMKGLTDRSWTPQQRVDLEHRLGLIEREVAILKETQELREKIMANILHSPHRPELDRLLEKIDRGEPLTDGELMFARQWLWEIITAAEDEGVSQGDKVSAGDIYASITVRNARREAHA